jgi:hypothetical protein
MSFPGGGFLGTLLFSLVAFFQENAVKHLDLTALVPGERLLGKEKPVVDFAQRYGAEPHPHPPATGQFLKGDDGGQVLYEEFRLWLFLDPSD